MASCGEKSSIIKLLMRRYEIIDPRFVAKLTHHLSAAQKALKRRETLFSAWGSDEFLSPDQGNTVTGLKDTGKKVPGFRKHPRVKGFLEATEPTSRDLLDQISVKRPKDVESEIIWRAAHGNPDICERVYGVREPKEADRGWVDGFVTVVYQNEQWFALVENLPEHIRGLSPVP